MELPRSGQLLRIFIGESDRYEGKPLYEWLVIQAKEQGLVGLKGHRSVGGCRASIYNAMSPEGVSALVEFMKEFARKNG